MSSYRNIIGILFIFLFYTGCSTDQPKVPNSKNDLMILLALDSEFTHNYTNSSKYYTELYDKLKKEKYLKKGLMYSYKAKKYDLMKKLAKDGIKRFEKNYEYYTQNLIIAYLSTNKIDKALSLAKELVKKVPKAVNYEIIANIYYVKKEYKNSLQYYESAYAQKPNLTTLLKLTNILYSYLNKKDIALAYLETYLQIHGCTKSICDRLLLIYKEQKNIDGMLSIFVRMYDQYKKHNITNDKTLLLENLIVTLLEKIDIKKAIKFLEKTKYNDTKLLSLYYFDGQIKKALIKTIKLYKKTKNPKLLGKIAMYRFELAKNKRKVIPNVMANFKLAFKKGVVNAGYYNYYGYLLIDYNIDVKKGISYIKKALKIAPNNIAFLDSLSWGYYKLKKCKKAYLIMDKIVKQIGIKDKEIKKHFDKINRCNKIKK
jgi:tetratricopeptide (TPR) repeat protein